MGAAAGEVGAADIRVGLAVGEVEAIDGACVGGGGVAVTGKALLALAPELHELHRTGHDRRRVAAVTSPIHSSTGISAHWGSSGNPLQRADLVVVAAGASVVVGRDVAAAIVEHTWHFARQICCTEFEIPLPWQSTGFSYSQASASGTRSGQIPAAEELRRDVKLVRVPVVALVAVVMVVEGLHVPQAPGHSASTNGNAGFSHRWAIKAHPAESALPL